MTQIKKFVIANTLACILLLLTFSLLSLKQFHAEALRENDAGLERCMQTFWALLKEKGPDFTTADGRLMRGSYLVNGNFEIPDKIREIFGGTATVFRGDLRVSTNVRQKDGSRAVGTRLVGPAYQALFKQGKPFRGEVDILGLPYLTAYDPIRDRQGKVIGALFVGLKKSEFLDHRDQLRMPIALILLGLSASFITFSVLLNTLMKKADRSKQAEQRFLQTLIDTIPNPVFYKDAHGKYLGCNKAYEAITGLPRGELSGKTVFDVLRGPLAEVQHQADQELLRSQDVQVYESAVQYADGVRHDVIVFKGTFPAEDGSLGGLIGTVLDISERKRSETYREMSREVLQSLNEPGDLSDTVRYVIAALKKRTGFDAVGIRLADDDDFPYYAQEGFPPDFLERENSLLMPSDAGGVCRDPEGKIRLGCSCGMVISGNGPTNQQFTPGGSFWTNDLSSGVDAPQLPRHACARQGYASLALVPIRDQDTIVGLIQLNDKEKGRFTPETIELLEGIASHIGAALMRKRAEEALREKEKEYRVLVENLPAGIVVHGPDSAVLLSNPMATHLLGLTGEQMRGKAGVDPAWCFLGEDGASLPPEAYPVSLVLASGKPIVNQMFGICRPDRPAPVWVLCNAYPVCDGQGSIAQVVISFVDITERKQAGEEKSHLENQLQQAQKMESVGRLAGGVAHDFNNMLGVILGHSELALMSVDPAQALHANLQEIHRAAERSAGLTQQLLAFARRQAITPKVLDLNEVVSGMLTMLQRLLGENVKLNWQPGANLWAVKVDQSQVDQILANLCINARDAITDVGKISIVTGNTIIDQGYCEMNAGFAPGEYVRIDVSDTGCGMNKETLAQIFEPFFTTKGLGEGTGLGLSTVYGAVRQNGGFINVYSEPGLGTKFTIYLPRHAARGVAADPEAETQPVTRGRETILLVEDEPAILNIITMVLSRLGYSVLAVNSPGEALRLAREHVGEIALLMTDVVMPEMNGRDLASSLQSLYPEIKRLFMSGYTADVIAHHGVLEEGVHFIQKPFSMPDLAAKAREVLDSPPRGRATLP